jgi:hypothetical protein
MLISSQSTRSAPPSRAIVDLPAPETPTNKHTLVAEDERRAVEVEGAVRHGGEDGCSADGVVEPDGLRRQHDVGAVFGEDGAVVGPLDVGCAGDRGGARRDGVRPDEIDGAWACEFDFAVDRWAIVGRSGCELAELPVEEAVVVVVEVAANGETEVDHTRLNRAVRGGYRRTVRVRRGADQHSGSAAPEEVGAPVGNPKMG